MNQKQLCIRIPDHELKILDHYARKTRRTKTDIVRELIRSLESKEGSMENIEPS
ncbi:MAG: ribbon-helix-helix protein, CopG family [Symploca sp. SIO3C6]|uniref:Ribbon-helix-helix protein, CopG family n=1 Tax=Symploca sp. SIO1C4 TaxID=2607765 RepID=A0A6B3NBA2_9CYAN|nr:ribbon-helix-helix protein, CopG family [Symploca sp. SIO3C6]NER28803.1 ribbon-helix-helix protein, CopG family [Symploca sp. SIO1C4]NET04655.1 ribbon-helix-helix protein, CopG family [Symploca sp. SIO2B6]